MDNNKNNEVFISFDVKDSSVSSFISYLIAAFNRQGISAFFKGKSSYVEAGERESEEERFSKLKVFVVVFSENYASHMPCLEKHVYACRNNGDFVVVPVFYHDSKSSVEQHMENSGDTFKAVRNSMPKLRRCHEYDGERSESEFQEEIARDVFEKLYPTEEIGIQSIILDIEDLLCKQPWGVRTIGIFGERGIGKTILAGAFFRRTCSGYDDSCFIKKFHKEYNEKGLEYLQPKYFSKTSMEKFHLNCSDSEPSYRKKRVIIALDDVRKAQDAKSFLGEFDKFGLGSLIILTSRDKRILQDCQMSEIYELKGLNDKDALKLFTRCAFGKDVIEENLLNDSVKAIECCKGNPSTLRLDAKEFKGKATIEKELVLPDVCEVFITGDDVSCDIVKNTDMQIIPCEEDDAPQENKVFPSDHNAVLATKDTKTIILTPSHLCTKREFQSYSDNNTGFAFYNKISKSIPSNVQFYRLDYNAVMRSLSEHLLQKHNVLVQGFASQLQILWQSLNSGDLGQVELDLQLLFNLYGDCDKIRLFIDVIRKNREMNHDGIYGLRVKRSRTTELLKFT